MNLPFLQKLSQSSMLRRLMLCTKETLGIKSIFLETLQGKEYSLESYIFTNCYFFVFLISFAKTIFRNSRRWNNVNNIGYSPWFLRPTKSKKKKTKSWESTGKQSRKSKDHCWNIFCVENLGFCLNFMTAPKSD